MNDDDDDEVLNLWIKEKLYFPYSSSYPKYHSPYIINTELNRGLGWELYENINKISFYTENIQYTVWMVWDGEWKRRKDKVNGKGCCVKTYVSSLLCVDV